MISHLIALYILERQTCCSRSYSSAFLIGCKDIINFIYSLYIL